MFVRQNRRLLHKICLCNEIKEQNESFLQQTINEQNYRGPKLIGNSAMLTCEYRVQSQVLNQSLISPEMTEKTSCELRVLKCD